ncbi:Hypothetical protein SRAE_2000166700 [Strongyloides ratti]|uniref:Uncharacterized protein n=1 Tax=Strongyloides ratti TaxID=34506 RepID=A0A090LB62_STRRB|nr:Hypothetical protein SRAE_2000166700 [Strongyloides ratti]CEF67002.1 Hypothetical protein SRAE_2000166700 [Strongyloides ratti]
MPKLLNLSIHLQNPLSEVGILINKCNIVKNLFIFVYLKHDEGFIEENWKNLLVASKNITTFTFSIYALCDCHNNDCFYYTTIPQYIYNNGSKLMKINGKEKFKLEYLTILNINHKIKCKVCKSYLSYIDRRCFVSPESIITLERKTQKIICLRTSQISNIF